MSIMKLEIFIALAFLAFMALSDLIATAGWMWSDARIKKLMVKLRRKHRELRQLLAENKRLKAQISFYKNLRESDNSGCDSVTD